VPTRQRNLNGYLLQWDNEALLFDPGEGTQRQMLMARVKSTSITRILITHLHGDHCLGLPGVVQRLALDGVTRPVRLYYPAGGREYLDRLLRSSVSHGRVPLDLRPVQDSGVVDDGPGFSITAARLEHGAEVFGWRLEEPAGRRIVPERCEELGVSGTQIVMDTRICDRAVALASNADMLVCESTYLSTEAALAQKYGHLTAAHAALIAREAGARLLVLTHFSQRYDDVALLLAEAQEVFPNTVAARDLDTIPVPARG